MSMDSWVLPQYEGAAVTYGKFETPHYVKANGGAELGLNEDHSLYAPDVGLLIADGVGSAEHSHVVSAIAVLAVEDRARELQLAMMTPASAVDAVKHDILPFADRVIGRYRAKNGLRRVGTTLGGLLIARDHLVHIGIGDSPVLGVRPNQAGNGVEHAEWITHEQISPIPGQEHIITNALMGNGRQKPDGTWINDQVAAFKPEPGDRFMVASDGLVGDRPHQRIPESEYGRNLLVGSALGVAESLAGLPLQLAERGSLAEGDEYPYSPKHDDLTIGVLIVHPPQR